MFFHSIFFSPQCFLSFIVLPFTDLQSTWNWFLSEVDISFHFSMSLSRLLKNLSFLTVVVCHLCHKSSICMCENLFLGSFFSYSIVYLSVIISHYFNDWSFRVSADSQKSKVSVLFFTNILPILGLFHFLTNFRINLPSFTPRHQMDFFFSIEIAWRVDYFGETCIISIILSVLILNMISSFI